MCGFAGFLSSSTYGLDVLTKMGSAIIHRGPDSEGAWHDKHAGIGSVHRRLPILDLSSADHQPMTSPHGRYCISFNGELHIHLDLRKSMHGFVWCGHSDTLLNRITKHFSESKIILCIREQRSMFTSLYLNYIKHGGYLSASKLVNEPCFDGFLIFDKLKYSNYLTKLYNLSS